MITIVNKTVFFYQIFVLTQEKIKKNQSRTISTHFFLELLNLLCSGQTFSDGSSKWANFAFVFLVHKAVFKEKKLRDVQQEREGASSNYFKVFFNYIEQFSWSILLYLSLSQSILDSWSISVYLGLSWTISDYLWLSLTISDYLWISLNISDYLGIYRTVWNNLGLFGAIWDYLEHSGTLWNYLGVSGVYSGLSWTIWNYLGTI